MRITKFRYDTNSYALEQNLRRIYKIKSNQNCYLTLLERQHKIFILFMKEFEISANMTEFYTLIRMLEKKRLTFYIQGFDVLSHSSYF